jgi:hypothetical protein
MGSGRRQFVPGQEPLPQPPQPPQPPPITTIEELRALRRTPPPTPPPERAPVDMVRDPNFDSSMRNQDYFNMLSQLAAERQARGPESGLMPIGNPDEARRMDAAMAERNAGLASVPSPAPVPAPVQQMGQMQNYNQMLQQGMRRNQDMNQAAQNLAAPAGPARSFSQVVGRTRRTPMPRPPVNNSLAPSNRRLI